MTFGSFRLNTLSAAMAAAAGDIVATGGTITHYLLSGTLYRVHTISTAGSNNFVVSSIGSVNAVDVLLVGAGGGSGGNNSGGTARSSGGGGGGEVKQVNSITITPQTYTVTVGAGGTGGNNTAGTAGGKGGSTTVLGNTAEGGGGGAGLGSGAAAGAGGNAGGGGGSSNSNTSGATGTLAGGNGGQGAGYASGGGGSNTSAGGDGSGTTQANATGGNAGAGVANTLRVGTTQYYASGGVGRGSTGGTVTNSGLFGNGAQGASSVSSTFAGNAGNAGAVVIRYPVTPVSSINYVTSATSTSTSITFPTVQSGDLALYLNVALNTNTTIPSTVTPTGFTSQQQNTISTTLGGRSNFCWKICDGTESGTTLTNASGTSSTQSTLFIYRGDIPISLATFVNGNTVFSDAASSAFSATMSTLSGPAVGLIMYSSSGSITSRPSTVTPSREIANGTNQYIQTFEATSSSVTFSNTTTSMADYGTNFHSFKLITIR
jgi:hypothetical protein